MDDADDFGDLYADLDCNFNQSLTKDDDEYEKKEKVESNVNEVSSVGNESESDDDLHIVLNDEDCDRNGVADVEANCEDDGVSKERERVVVSPGDGCEERGSAAKSGYFNGHVGSHLGGFLGSSRTSMSGRGNRDQLMMPCIGDSTSYNPDFSAVAQNGVGFSLPRNRTIFDINIEAFEHKPWRHHGVDMTDYFNFGLNEESWKSYCECLDNFRQQATVSSRFPYSQSSRLNQGGRSSSVLENVEKGQWEFNLPKGRAIQVEGGLGERIPSTDIRRPRHRDSDVVIQITMEGSMKDPSVLCENSSEQVGHIDASLSNSGSKSNERMLSPHHDGQIFRDADDATTSVEHGSTEMNGTTSRGTSGETKSKVVCKRGDEEDPMKIDACMSEDGFDSSDDSIHSSSSFDVGSHSEESKDARSSEKHFRHFKKTPLRSITGLQASAKSDYYLSNGCRSDAIVVDEEDKRESTHEFNLSSGGHNHFSRTRLRSVAELNVSMDDQLASDLTLKKHRNDNDLWDANCKARERKHSYRNYVRESLYSRRETKTSPSYKGRISVAKYGNKKSYSKDSRRGDCDFHPERSLDEEEFLNQRDYSFKRRDEDRGDRGFSDKESDQTISRHESFFLEKDSCLRQAKERGDERPIRMATAYRDSIIRRRYREQRIREILGRRAPCFGMEETFDIRFHRHVYTTARDIQNPERRSRYDRRSYFELNRSIQCTDNVAEDRRLLASDRYRDPSTTDKREWHDAASPRSHLPISWMSCERRNNCRGHSDIGELQLKKKSYGDVVPSIRDHHHSSYENILEPAVDEYTSEGEDIYGDNIVSRNKMRRGDWLQKQKLLTDDATRFRHHEPGCFSSPERSIFCKGSSRHIKSYVRQPSVSGQTFSGDCRLNDARKEIIFEESYYDRDHINSLPDIHDRDRHELAAAGCREAVDMHLNGWKGKLARKQSGDAGKRERQTDTVFNVDEPESFKHPHCSINSLQLARKQSGDAGKRERQTDTVFNVDEPENFKHPKKAYKPEEVHSHVLRSEGSRHHQTSLKSDMVKDSKPSNHDSQTKISLDKLPNPQDLEDTDIEEGELIEEPGKQSLVSSANDLNSEEKVGKNPESKDSSCIEKVVAIYDSKHILETLAKMEKRKQRFKEPIATKQGPEKSVNLQSDVSAETDEVKQQRPARKRRWGGNKS